MPKIPFKDPVKRKEYLKKYKKEHIEQTRRYARGYYRRHKSERAAYNRMYNEKHKKEIQEYGKKYREQNREECRKRRRVSAKKFSARHGMTYQTFRNHATKKEILIVLGDRCSQCGESDRRCLQIDHIGGGGCRERKQFGGNQGRFYKFVLERIKAGSEDYQLLCANCNWKKRYENGEDGNAYRNR